MHLVLASTSSYRRQLLDRLCLPFEVRDPQVVETTIVGEEPAARAARLARAKADGARRPGAPGEPAELLIGSDQVALLDGQILNKPGSRQANIAQLSAASGRCVEFLTGVCTLNAGTNRMQTDVVPFRVQFRELSSRSIEQYVDLEPASDCAGGFKAEGLGVSLFESMSGPDPTALIGLPLLTLCRMLRAEGVDPLA